jgi:rod shape determining protein RodA
MAQNYKISIGQKKSETFEWQLLLVVLGLLFCGLLSIYSATHDSNMSHSFSKQLNSVLIGLTGMFIIAYLPQKLIRYSSYIFYGFSIVLLIYVLKFGVGVYGTRGWIKIASFTFQPAEISKLAVLLALAEFLSDKGRDIRNWRDLGTCLLLAATPVGLIILQPDIGSSTVILALLMGVLFWAGFDALFLFFILTVPIIIIASLKGTIFVVVLGIILSSIVFTFKKRIFSSLLVIGVYVIVGISSPIIYDHLMPHQKSRIDTFLYPGSNPLGSGYNVLQSIMAVGSGGFSGKGFMQGTQTQLRYIPMQWTDFIYSVPTEEFGFIGGFIVLLLLVGLLLKSLKIAKEVDSKYFSIVAFGAMTIFLYHTIINIGMVIGLMPVMGIPLPLVSYGGTSVIFNLALIGLLLNAYRSYKVKSRGI